MLARHCLYWLLEKPLPESTRRGALLLIAAGGVAAQALDAADHEPQAFAADQFRLLERLVDIIVPDSDAPGAQKAGVAAMIDEDAADSRLKRHVQGALARLSSDGFADYTIAGDEPRQHFQLIKDLTVDRYYATEIGPVHELGYQGNTYLAEFPGRQHEEHA